MKTTAYPFCSIIVLNYFGQKVLQNTITSLLNLSYPPDKYEIVIVDNNSKDGSRRLIKNLKKKHKTVRYIFLDKNLGFSKGNNIGIIQAKGEYIALLNNDCIVDKCWLSELVKTAVKDKKIFAVNSKIYLRSSKKVQNAGIMVFQDGYGRDIGAKVKYQSQDYENDYGQYDNEQEIYAACGAASLFSKEHFKKLGYLDQDFFMYYEDVEISERARFHGYKILYCPRAITYHYHAFSSIEWSAKFIYNTEKGRLLHVFFNFPFVIFFKEYWNFFFLSILRLIKEAYIFKKFKINIQYVFISVYFPVNFPRLIIKRIHKHHDILKNAIQDNYQKILIGYWYFH